MKKLVAFDARMASHPGIGRYIQSLLSKAVKNSRYRFRLIGESRYLSEHADDADVIECSYPIYSIKEFFGMPKFFSGADLVHVPHFNVPAVTFAPLVVTIHDLIHFQIPEYRKFPGAYFLLDRQIRHAVRKAKAVIAVSKATRRAIEKRYPDTRKKTRVIYEAADEALLNAGEKPQVVGDSKYILTVGSIREHKNVHGVLKAFESIQKEFPDLKLVIVGNLDRRFEQKHGFNAYVESHPNIIHVSGADDRMLSSFYKHAECLVAASFVEGFGLPVIEAMRLGTACAVSRGTSLDEVAGEACAVFDPSHTDEIAAAVLKILKRTDYQNHLEERGIARAGIFSWDKCAEETLALYDKVLAS